MKKLTITLLLLSNAETINGMDTTAALPTSTVKGCAVAEEIARLQLALMAVQPRRDSEFIQAARGLPVHELHDLQKRDADRLAWAKEQLDFDEYLLQLHDHVMLQRIIEEKTQELYEGIYEEKWENLYEGKLEKDWELYLDL